MAESTNASLTGAQKVAAMMIALGEERVAPLLDLFDDNELQEIRLAMDEMGKVDSGTLERLFDEIADGVDAAEAEQPNLIRTA